METFQKRYVDANKKSSNFSKAISKGEEEDIDEDEVSGEIIDAGAKVVLGMWLELHRIADALDDISRDLMGAAGRG